MRRRVGPASLANPHYILNHVVKYIRKTVDNARQMFFERLETPYLLVGKPSRLAPGPQRCLSRILNQLARDLYGPGFRSKCRRFVFLRSGRANLRRRRCSPCWITFLSPSAI